MLFEKQGVASVPESFTPRADEHNLAEAAGKRSEFLGVRVFWVGAREKAANS